MTKFTEKQLKYIEERTNSSKMAKLFSFLKVTKWKTKNVGSGFQDIPRVLFRWWHPITWILILYVFVGHLSIGIYRGFQLFLAEVYRMLVEGE